jgi:hypothetical protein
MKDMVFARLQRLVLKNFRRSWYISTEDLVPKKGSPLDFIYESDNGAFVLLPWNISTFLRPSYVHPTSILRTSTGSLAMLALGFHDLKPLIVSKFEGR